MKLRKKIISAITPLSILALSTSTATADTFVMKDGSKINGSIISETTENYTLRAEVSKNVYGEKTILKSNVTEIKKIDPSIAAYKKLTTILPTPDLMSSSDYQKIISSQVAPFIKKYPSSPHLKDAEKILSTLNKEYHTIKSGGIKLSNKLITEEQIAADKYNVQATIAYYKFINYAKRKQYRAALSTLEQLENGYADSMQCRKAQKIALNILPRYKAKLQKLHDDVEHSTQKRERALEGMSPGDQSRTTRLFQQEDQQYQTLLAQTTENNRKAKWLPINPYFIEPIEHNLKMVESEEKRITKVSEEPVTDAGSLFRNTYTALEAGDYPTAKEHFDQFKRTKPPEHYIDELEPKLETAKSVMEQMEKQKKEDEKLAKEKARAEEKAAREQAKEELDEIPQ